MTDPNPTERIGYNERVREGVISTYSNPNFSPDYAGAKAVQQIKPIPQLNQEYQDLFWSRVHKTETCWLWTGPVTLGGYGNICLNGVVYYAHRVAYTLLVGPIPDGLPIDHVKDRGCNYKSCVNPDHLEPVTNWENTMRGINMTAINARKTHCLRGHEFTPENTYLYKNGRTCRECTRIRVEARKLRLECRPIESVPGWVDYKVSSKYKTHCKYGHEFTPDNTYFYRDGHRACRLCRLLRRPILRAVIGAGE